jgi:hypothetical protein
MGHFAMSCDLLPSDSPGHHYTGSVLDVLDHNWDLMIAHPPCTYLSNAGARFLYPKSVLNEERFAKGLDAKQFFMLLYNANIPQIAIENPIPSKVYDLPAYTQIIEPYQFGHPFKKKTCLWLKNLPNLVSTNVIPEREREYKNTRQLVQQRWQKQAKRKSKNFSRYCRCDGYSMGNIEC